MCVCCVCKGSLKENKDLVSKHWKRNCLLMKISSPHMKERTTSYLQVVRKKQDNHKL